MTLLGDLYRALWSWLLSPPTGDPVVRKYEMEADRQEAFRRAQEEQARRIVAGLNRTLAEYDAALRLVDPWTVAVHRSSKVWVN